MTVLASRRRWSFSLRTLFVSVTMAAILIGLIVGYPRKWIRQREDFIAGSSVGKPLLLRLPRGGAPIPLWMVGLRWLLGADLSYCGDILALDEQADDGQLTRVQRLFPEARVIRDTPARRSGPRCFHLSPEEIDEKEDRLWAEFDRVNAIDAESNP